MAQIARRAVRPDAAKPVKSDVPEIEELSRQLSDMQRAQPPWSKGVTREVTWTGAGVQLFSHGLGRPVIGWIVLRLRSQNNPVITERTAPDNNSISLYSSADATATILVY